MTSVEQVKYYNDASEPNMKVISESESWSSDEIGP